MYLGCKLAKMKSLVTSLALQQINGTDAASEQDRVMTRQINTMCNFVLGYVKCQLSEYTVDVHVRIRTLQGTHTLKEDWEYCALKFKPWGSKAKPFKALWEKLSQYIHGRESDAAAATPVTPNNGQERRQGFGQPPAVWSATRYTRRNMSDNTASSPQPVEQLQPKIWLKLRTNHIKNLMTIIMKKKMTIVTVAPLWDISVYAMNQITQIGHCITSICLSPR